MDVEVFGVVAGVIDHVFEPALKKKSISKRTKFHLQTSLP